MALTINLPTTIESQLKKEAASNGMSLDNYLVRLLRHATSVSKKKLSKSGLSESALLGKINLEITELEWIRYKELLKLRRAENLTEQQYDELISLNDKIEIANAKRIQYLAELAQLRSTTLDKLMLELGIKPVEV